MRWIKNLLGISHLETELNHLRMELHTVQQRYKRMEKTWQQATLEITDLNLKQGNTRVVVASNLGQGFSKWYELNFDSVVEFVAFCDMLKDSQVSSYRPFIDAPPAFREGFHNFKNK